MTAVVNEHLEPDEIFSLAMKDETHGHLASCQSCADQHARAVALLAGPIRRQSPIVVPPVARTGQSGGGPGAPDGRRNPLVIAAAAGVAVVLLALVGWMVLGRGGSDEVADGSGETSPGATQPDAGSDDAGGQRTQDPVDRVRLRGPDGTQPVRAEIAWTDGGMTVALPAELVGVTRVWITHDIGETPLEPGDTPSVWTGSAIQAGVLHVETAGDTVTQPATYEARFGKRSQTDQRVAPPAEAVP